MVKPYNDIIEAAAARYGVNPDLVRAIMYMETTHGWYDDFAEPFDANDSILPMNINTAYWGDAWGTREELKSPEANIDAGVRMIKKIIETMDNPSVSEVASVYNNSNTNAINEYGRRVQSIYIDKPWLQQDINRANARTVRRRRK